MHSFSYTPHHTQRRRRASQRAAAAKSTQTAGPTFGMTGSLGSPTITPNGGRLARPEKLDEKETRGLREGMLGVRKLRGALF